MRFAVLYKGVLRGMGREAACELLATKTILPEAARAVYSHCAVIEAPTDLPDGHYELEFADEVAVVTLHGGTWAVGRMLPHTYSEAASVYAAEMTQSEAEGQRTMQRKSERRPRESSGPARL